MNKFVYRNFSKLTKQKKKQQHLLRENEKKAAVAVAVAKGRRWKAMATKRLEEALMMK